MIVGNKVELSYPRRAEFRFVVDLRNANKDSFFSPGHVTLDSHARWYEGVLCDPTQEFYAIRAGGALVGTVSLYHIDYYHRRAEYGRFVVAEGHRRKGYGREALFLLLCRAFDGFHLKRVWGDLLADNGAAIALDESLGFAREGTFRGHVRKGDAFLDVVRMAVLKDEFEKRRERVARELGL